MQTGRGRPVAAGLRMTGFELTLHLPFGGKAMWSDWYRGDTARLR